VQDFHKHAQLAAFLPEYARLSLSWVRLLPGEILEPHRHPTQSMIIVCEGTGIVTGDCQGSLSAGDIVAVPSGALHGFIGSAPTGFWGLSLQFEGTGLYEDLEAPRVSFQRPAALASSPVDRLLQANKRYTDAYWSNPLIRLVQFLPLHDTPTKAALLDALQVWSDTFQRLVHVRVQCETDPVFQALAQAHLEEERGHNLLLAESRGKAGKTVYDPTLTALGEWFVDQMAILSGPERAVLVHLVLEASGEIFPQAARHAFPTSAYFALHAEEDGGHVAQGYEVLRGLTGLDVQALEHVLDQGWQAMNALCTRIAELAIQGGRSTGEAV
jgi:quercetin dioxygenase-like cupin family protein